MFWIILRFLTIPLILGVVVYFFLKFTKKEVLVGEDIMQDQNEKIIDKYVKETEKENENESTSGKTSDLGNRSTDRPSNRGGSSRNRKGRGR